MHEDVIEGFRLSPQQERVWLLQQSDHGLSPYIHCAVLIEGNLDPQALQAAVQQVVDQHEILRTTFQSLPGMTLPLQVIHEDEQVVIHDLPPGDRRHDREASATIEAAIRDMARQPRDLTQRPLARFWLRSLSNDRHLLVISVPTLCADAATLPMLVEKLSRCYAAQRRGEDHSDESMQYADFSEWQHELLAVEDTEAARLYWRKQNLTSPTSLKLPFEKPSPAQAEFAPVSLGLPIDPELGVQIEAVARDAGVTTSAFFLACWQILLWRFNDQPGSVMVGTAFDGRKYAELEDMLGLCARYVPLQAQFDANQSLMDALAQVHRQIEAASTWQEGFAWDSIPEAESVSHPPFFPFCFEAKEQRRTFAADGVTFSLDHQQAEIERFNIKLTCQLDEAALNAVYTYDPGVFAAEDIQRLAEHFLVLLRSAATHPEYPISRLEMMSDDQRRHVLAGFNKTQVDLAHDSCIHHLFEEQARHTPDRVAITFADRQLNFADLNARANQLAHHLRGLGVGPETRVAICLERSVELVVGLLAILKAGGAYVPLDPAYPQERLQFMLEDSQATVLLTRSELLSKLLSQRIRCICLDTDAASIGDESAENPSSAVVPANLAYIIYTSGSTGSPKGVMVTHKSLVHSTNARMHYYAESIDSFLVLSSFAFDSSVAGIFWTLCQGGRLVLPTEEDLAQPLSLIDLIDRQQISHMLSLPSLYTVLLDQARTDQLGSLRTSIVAGEACPRELVAQHEAALPQAALYNEYGPTEGTVWSSVYRCRSSDPQPVVAIGRPIANTQIYLVDHTLSPLPIGLPGELYVGGLGLARGYHNRPALTAERFIPNPFSALQGDRLYRTGDVGRYRADGTIEFLGRADHQVKIRGYRIELGEIEAVLSQYPGIREVVVTAWEESPGDKRLVAYLVTDPNVEPSADEVRQFLGTRLPDYMVPAIFVLLQALPHLPNGKVNRAALPAPDASRPRLTAAYVAPRTPIEESVAEIWVDLLKLERVGVNDNFFDLGGHSLLATQLFSRLYKTFDVQLSVRSVFEKPTVAGLAEMIVQHQIELTNQDDLANLLMEVEQLSAHEAISELRSAESDE